ncbi:hypothetical protein RJT34_30386 [Clitoria ternatea]|uniref:Uncharacterized protein n=1 Tax=Clitoria ternatea TaxID=43366 RepID=A0AAN9EUF4_CLITE
MEMDSLPNDSKTTATAVNHTPLPLIIQFNHRAAETSASELLSFFRDMALMRHMEITDGLALQGQVDPRLLPPLRWPGGSSRHHRLRRPLHLPQSRRTQDNCSRRLIWMCLGISLPFLSMRTITME